MLLSIRNNCKRKRIWNNNDTISTLADVNGKSWICEVERNIRTDKVVVKVKFE
jgi:hypothetical protein